MDGVPESMMGLADRFHAYLGMIGLKFNLAWLSSNR